MNKMKTFKYLIISALSFLMLASCSHEVEYLEARGEGLLSFNIDFDLNAELMTKSSEVSELIFKVEIKDVSTGVIVKQFDDHRDLKDVKVSLRAGKYEVIATCGEDTEAAFDAPYYKGSELIEVLVGKETTANIVCSLANVKVTIAVSDTVKKYFTKYPVTISNEAPDGELLFAGPTSFATGYLKCTGVLAWTIALTNIDGTEFDPITGFIDNVKPRQYYHLNFDIKDNGESGQGGVTLRITLDGTLIEKEHDVNINLNNGPMPEIKERSGQDLSNVLNVPQGVGDFGLFTVISAVGFEQLTITHNSDKIEALGVPRSINVLTTSSTQYASQGLIWSGGAVKGGNTAEIDFREMFSSKLDLGVYQFKINVLDAQSQYVSLPLTIKIIPNSEVTTLSIDPWAKFANISAQYNTETEPAGMGFQYRKATDASWTDFGGTLTRTGKIFSAKITGLEPSTEYQFRAVTASEQKDENILVASTEAAEQLPNFNFDNWFQDGKNWYASPDKASIFWDSGNVGANTLSAKNPTSPEDSKVISGRAVKMETMAIVGIMAGGNIYSGSFGGTVGTSGAKVNFGRPYTCRPLALHGYYAYTPKSIDKTKDPWGSLKGQNDIGKIFVVLADWDSPFVVNNAADPMILFDPNDPGVIAYGELEDNVGTPNGNYKEFTIDLKYRDNRKPKHVIVVACSSKYADYFTGAVGSVMYIDEFEFLFE